MERMIKSGAITKADAEKKLFDTAKKSMMGLDLMTLRVVKKAADAALAEKER